MTNDARRGEWEYRHTKPKRLPQDIPEPPPSRQGMFTAFAVWSILIALLAWYLLR